MSVPRGPAAKPARAAPCIFLVEDTTAVRDLLTDYLEQANYRVVSCSSAEDVLLRWPAVASEVVALITDVVLGGMSGRELALQLRKGWPELPVVFISGYREGKARMSRSAYLEKPFSMQRLIEVMERLLAESA